MNARQRRKTFALSRVIEPSEFEAAFNLSRQKAFEKEEEENEKQLKIWISKLLNEDLTPQIQGASLFDYLSNGVRLCQLLNTVIPGSVKKFYTAIQHRPIPPYKRLDNINQFLETCAKNDVLPEAEHFLTVDLYEQKNMQRVRSFLLAFMKAAGEDGKNLLKKEPKAPTKSVGFGSMRREPTSPRVDSALSPRADSAHPPRVEGVISPRGITPRADSAHPPRADVAHIPRVDSAVSPRGMISPRRDASNPPPPIGIPKRDLSPAKKELSPRSLPVNTPTLPSSVSSPIPSSGPQLPARDLSLVHSSEDKKKPSPRADERLPPKSPEVGKNNDWLAVRPGAGPGSGQGTLDKAARLRATTSLKSAASSSSTPQPVLDPTQLAQVTELRQLQMQLAHFEYLSSLQAIQLAQKGEADDKLKAMKEKLKSEKEKVEFAERESDKLRAEALAAEDAFKKAEEDYFEQQKQLLSAQERKKEEEEEEKNRKALEEERSGVARAKLIDFSDLVLEKKLLVCPTTELYQASLLGELVLVKKFVSADSKTQFQKELDIYNHLSSGYLAQVIGYSHSPPAIAMEYHARGSLDLNIEDTDVKLPWKRKWKLALGIAIAIAHLHTRNPPTVHRTLSSANFLVRDDWKVQLFGFESAVTAAKALAEGPVQHSRGVQWTAPEVLSGKPPTEKSDIYSFALVLYEIATRKAPWGTETEDLEKKIISGERPPIPDDVPSNFKELIERCWKADESMRPNSKELLQLLEDFLIDENLEDLNEEVVEEGAEEQVEALEQEIEVQKMLCGMARERADDSENALETELNRSYETKRKLIDVEVKVDQLMSEIDILKQTLDEGKEKEKKLSAKIHTLDDQVSESARKVKRLEKQVERYKKRGEEEAE